MKTLCLFGLLAIVGCSHAPDDDEIHYFKDARTDLCFATAGYTSGNNYVMTCVPCTEKVMQRIQNQR